MSKILVTGFGPFPRAPWNPSGEVARALQGAEISGYEVVSAVLPVSYESAAKSLAALVSRHQPGIAISLGVGVEQRALLETTARKRCDASQSDVDGVCLAGRELEPGGPAHRRGSWDAPRLAASLDRPELPVACSEDAGGYVCNAAYYHLLSQLEALPVAAGGRVSGFLHLPAWLEPAALDPLLDLVHRLLRLTTERRAVQVEESP